jgi:carbamoyl-phosphate synthase large subunit
MRRNVLITSAGRRAKLVQAFRNSLDDLSPGSRVFAADMRPELSVACHLAHRAFTLPHCADAQYIQRLSEVCEANSIGLIVPTIDTELPILAEHRANFLKRGVTVVVSDTEFVRICGDKRRTAEWFAERGVPTPRVIDPRAVAGFPIFSKPYDGSCSRETRIIRMPCELTEQLLNDERMMFVEFLDPVRHQEYTVDMYYDRDGLLKCLVPRLRLETRAGEVSKSRTARVPAIEQLRGSFDKLSGARGCVTLQLFLNLHSHKLCAIEINPRFGGGYPLSREAGADFPRWLIQEYLLGMQIGFFDAWESDLTMLRYDDHVIVRGAAA